ncbi:MAG TPA: tetratricopeptide repeat protein [Planctomycetota bacterium]|nr:tetratricopeptide repeat protein [Planctomycetota bacterium]
MTFRLLLLGVLLSVVARAADVEIVEDKDVEPQKNELGSRLDQIRKGALKIDELISYYQRQSVAAGTTKQQAINAYMYGFVLANVVQAGRAESKDAKREFQRALDLMPGFLPAYADLALLAEAAQDLSGAEALLRKALQLKPGYQRGYVQLGTMAMQAEDFDRARQLFEKALGADQPTAQVYIALSMVYLKLYGKTYDEKEKERCANRALAAADAVRVLEPDNQMLRLFKATVYRELDRPAAAIDHLERLYQAGDLKPEMELRVLSELSAIYQKQADVEGVKRTAERFLKCEKLPPQQRAKIAARLKDLEAIGRNAFVKWRIDDAIEAIHNEGLSVEGRLYFLRALWDLILSPASDVPDLKPLMVVAWNECFRTLVDGPPEVQVAQLRALRNMPRSARLMPVLVHFVHPEGKTPEIREEGIRTMAALAGEITIPAIYFSLQDDAGNVVREADSQLSILCERRSPLGGGIAPFTPEQSRQARRFWTGYFHSEGGSERLAKSFAALGDGIARLNPELINAPMIDHAAHVLLDDDMQWAAWSGAYDFLVKYWGKEFRPVERRGKPVEPSERASIVQEFDKEYKGAASTVDTDKPGPVPDAPNGIARKEN